MTVAHPLHTRNGRVVKGYLPLVPVRKSSRYRAYILVEPADKVLYRLLFARKENGEAASRACF